MTELNKLHDQGQSIWYDFIRRDMLEGRGLSDLVNAGVRGVTSNPSIFEKAIAGSALYDDQIAELGISDAQGAFEALAITDSATPPMFSWMCTAIQMGLMAT